MVKSADRVAARVAVAILGFALGLHPPVVLAWGAGGHEAVAIVADQALLPSARQRLNAILALEPGATLVSISNWADQSRNRSTAAWHFANLPRGADCVYVPARDCPGGQCVVAALTTQTHRLATATGAEQLEALKYVVHFVGDIHQPLHAGFADDKGGNTYQLQAFGRGTNLHRLWDTDLLRDISPNSASLARVLAGRPAPAGALAFAPEQWAAESCRIASRPDFYPSRRLTDDYLRVFQPIAMDRVALAGLRLAATLNQVLGGPSLVARRLSQH